MSWDRPSPGEDPVLLDLDRQRFVLRQALADRPMQLTAALAVLDEHVASRRAQLESSRSRSMVCGGCGATITGQWYGRCTQVVCEACKGWVGS